MEQAYVHDWVAFLAVQFQNMPVKLRMEGVELYSAKAWVAFPIAQMHAVLYIIRSVGCAKLRLLSVESAHFKFHF